MNFINTNGFINEILTYTSNVNYKQIYENLPDEIKVDLLDEAKACSKLLITDEDDDITVSSYISIAYESELSAISEIPIEIELFIGKYKKAPHRVGFIVYVKNSCFSNRIQSFYLRIDDLSYETIINGLYNVLFYMYVVVREFKYNPLFHSIYHRDEIDEMIKIRLRRLRLFGNDDMKCPICMETTIVTTYCNHYLCQRCFAKLNNRICPICRELLDTHRHPNNNTHFGMINSMDGDIDNDSEDNEDENEV